MNLTPMLPRNPALPSCGPTTLVAIVSILPPLIGHYCPANIYTLPSPSVKIPRTPMTDQKRPYKMKRRAELEQATRERITESAVHLHGTSAPCARRSVRSPSTPACGARPSTGTSPTSWRSSAPAPRTGWRPNPAPDIALWAACGDPDERLSRALGELYAYYRSTRAMLENLYRDQELSASVAVLFSGFRDYLDAAHATLMAGRGVRGHARRRVRATIGHAIAFATWRSLAVEQALDDDEIVALMRSLVAAA